MAIGSRSHCSCLTQGPLFRSLVLLSVLWVTWELFWEHRKLKSTTFRATFAGSMSSTREVPGLDNWITKRKEGNCLNRIIRGRFTLSWKRIRKLGTSFRAEEGIRKSFGEQQTFPSSCKGCVLCESERRRKSRKKQMGKLCVVLITFSPSSGPSISTRNRVHWVKLSLISFLSRKAEKT